jgi:hypothetical protein
MQQKQQWGAYCAEMLIVCNRGVFRATLLLTFRARSRGAVCSQGEVNTEQFLLRSSFVWMSSTSTQAQFLRLGKRAHEVRINKHHRKAC